MAGLPPAGVLGQDMTVGTVGSLPGPLSHRVGRQVRHRAVEDGPLNRAASESSR